MNRSKHVTPVTSVGLRTGYFARATEKDYTAKFTKVHLVTAENAAICGYKPHSTMQFQWNANGVYLPYVECEKCKKKLATTTKLTLTRILAK